MVVANMVAVKMFAVIIQNWVIKNIRL
jgi:hypothetical protein